MSEPHGPLGPRLFGKLARYVTAARWFALTSCLALTGLTGWRVATHLEVNHRSESLLGSSSPSMTTLRRLEAQFGHDKVFLVTAQGDVFSPAFLTRLTALHARIEGLGLQVSSLASASQLVSAPGGLALEPLLDGAPSRDNMEALQRAVLNNPALVENVVSADGQGATLLVRSERHDDLESLRICDALQTVLNEEGTEGFRLHLSGMAALDAALDHSMQRDLPLVLGACLGVMLLILAFLYRSLFGIVGPILVVVQAVVWTLGAMAYFEVPVTAVTSVLAAFLVCVGMADSIHVQSLFRDQRRDGATPRDAVIGALAQTGVPVLLTSLTTMAGLLSFRTASLAAIVDMGTFGALGVAAALLLSLVFLPAFLTLHRGGGLGARAAQRRSEAAPPAPDLLERLLRACEAVSRPTRVNGALRYRRRNLTLLVSAALLVTSGFGLARLHARHDPLRWLPADHPTRVAIEAVDDAFGGTSTMQVLISAPLGQTLQHEDVMRRLAALETYALAYRAHEGGDERVVTGVTSVLDPLRAGQRALSGEPDGYGLPESEQRTIALLDELRALDPAGLRRLISDDGTYALMTLRVRWLEAGEYRPLAAYLEEGIREHIGSAAHVELTGTAYAGVEVVNALMTDLSKSFLAALGVVTLLLVMLFGDLKLGLVAMLPSLLPLAIVGGAMGALDIPLDLNTLMVASIAIGIAVDDTIHFFYAFHAAQPRAGTEGGIHSVFAHTARAIVATSAVLALGFSTYGFAGLANIRHFGFLVALTVTVALVSDLVFTPALLRAIYTEPKGTPDTD